MKHNINKTAEPEKPEQSRGQQINNIMKTKFFRGNKFPLFWRGLGGGLFCIIMLCGVLGGYAQNTPPHAASAKTWTFGGLTWSDAIRIPGCNKNTFTNSYTEPQCRSYNRWYYYNWTYVNEHAAQLCPTPWRVPAKPDFEVLVAHAPETTLYAAWGYGGFADDNSMYYQGSGGYYWSSTEYSGEYAYFMRFSKSFTGRKTTYKIYGYQVRCVQ